MNRIHVAAFAAAFACASLSIGVASADDTDNVIGQLSAAQQHELLEGAAPGGVILADGRSLEEGIHKSMGMSETLIYSKWYPGSQLALGTSQPNDAAWFFNAPNNLASIRTEVTATVVHGGFLNQTGSGWDHLAVLTRGTNLESSLQYMGYPANTQYLQFYGEALSGGPTVTTFARGRGPTFWAKGTGFCGNTALPCMILENYTAHLSGNGLITEAPVPLALSDGPFDVYISTTSSNIEVMVTQNGQIKGFINCQLMRPGDQRCGGYATDTVHGDVAYAHVMHAIPPAHAHRQVGVVNVGVSLYRINPNVPPCLYCPIP